MPNVFDMEVEVTAAAPDLLTAIITVHITVHIRKDMHSEPGDAAGTLPGAPGAEPAASGALEAAEAFEMGIPLSSWCLLAAASCCRHKEESQCLAKALPNLGALLQQQSLSRPCLWPNRLTIGSTFLDSGKDLRHTRAEWMNGQHTVGPGGLARADLGWGVSAWPNCSASGSISSSEKAVSTPWVFAAPTCSQPPMSTT